MRADGVPGKAEAKSDFPDGVDTALQEVHHISPAAAKTGPLLLGSCRRVFLHVKRIAENTKIISQNSFDYLAAMFKMGRNNGEGIAKAKEKMTDLIVNARGSSARAPLGA